MVQLIETIESRFLWFVERPILSILILWTLALAMYGLAKYPTMHYYLMAVNLGETAELLPYLQDSILLPMLGHFLGLASEQGYYDQRFFLFLAFCYAMITTGFVYTAVHLRDRFGREPALLALVFLTLHPVILVLITRLGLPDALTFLFAAVVLVHRSAVVLFAVALLGMTNHPIFLFLAPPLVLLRMYASSDNLSVRHLVAVVAGLAVGRLVVDAFFQLYGIPHDLGHMATPVKGDGSWFLQAFGPLHLIAFSFHNFAWFAIIACVAYGFNRSRGYFVVLLLTQGLAFAVASATIDPTRIFTLIAWASLVHCIVYTLQLAGQAENPKTDYTTLRRALLTIAGLGFLIPPFTVYSGQVYGHVGVGPIWVFQNVISPWLGTVFR